MPGNKKATKNTRFQIAWCANRFRSSTGRFEHGAARAIEIYEGLQVGGIEGPYRIAKNIWLYGMVQFVQDSV
ncbi:hypothetical protein DCC81_21685 [Chitinophaga parva]|uniref:Uncharacterized protein n=1 Tax=Chitinophaga parva TaxID=2169414 RepID=A0A2T7BD51_9BACT|nr:hypothetical protein DCC81_21685 [Chitinophaga parva]